MKEKAIIATTIYLTKEMHTRLKLMCIYTESSMSQFIRIAIRDKIDQLKDKK